MAREKSWKSADVPHGLGELQRLLQALAHLLDVPALQVPVDVPLHGERAHLEVERLHLLRDQLALRRELQGLVVELPGDLHVREVEVCRRRPAAVPELLVQVGGGLQALLGLGPVPRERLQVPLEDSIGLARLQLELGREDGDLLRQALRLLDVAELAVDAGSGSTKDSTIPFVSPSFWLFSTSRLK